MTDPKYSDKPPHMPPGWVAIPVSALKRVGAQAMLSSLELEQVKDPDSYKHHVRVRMFIDIANLLHRDYGDTIEVRTEIGPHVDPPLPAPRGWPVERWNLTIWCVDPLYMEAREKARSDSRTTERALST